MELFKKRSSTRVLLKAGTASLMIHGAIIGLFTLNPWPQWIRTQPIVYTVSLMPLVLPEPETASAYALPAPREVTPKPVETKKPLDTPKKDDIVEKIKKPSKKVEKPEEPKLEKPEPEKPTVDQRSLKGLQEALDDIRRKVALDDIQRRVAHREKTEKERAVTSSEVPSAKSPTPAQIESRMNEYYGRIWAKIKQEWTIPENLLKEMVDLETIIVIIIERDGKIQRSWFEKRSGDTHYDQAAMRAILKSDPLPPIPRDLSETTLEIGIRFYPD